MKRYIEIVFDDSSSMTQNMDNRPRHKIAKELFKKNIAPIIGLPNDKIILRLLRNNCSAEISSAVTLPNDFSKICKFIDGINTFDKMTPLYKTVSDSITACKYENADEYHIFVLTDGGDNCFIPLEDIIDEEDLKFITFMNVSTLIVQFAIDNVTTTNNLSGLAQFVKGRTVSIGNNGDTDFNFMSKKLKSAITKSGLSNLELLPQCFTNLSGKHQNWNDIENAGYTFHLSLILHNEGILSWIPNTNKPVAALEFAELEFLYSLFYKSGFSFGVAKSMLIKLQKPYYYSYSCIYWDFKNSKWSYFPETHKINIVNDESVINADKQSRPEMEVSQKWQKLYKENSFYEVKLEEDYYEWNTVDHFKLSETDTQKIKKILYEGDFVVFKKKRKKNR